MKTFPAKIRETIGGFEALVYVKGSWRSFGRIYKAAKCEFKKFTTKKSAERSADNVASAFGIKLRWEEKSDVRNI